MRSKRMVFGIVIFLFAITGICSVQNVSGIENPDYTRTIPPGAYFKLGIYMNEGDKLKIEYEVISGANKDVDFYIQNSDEYIVKDYGRVIGHGLTYFTAPYNDDFGVIFSNTFSIITSKVIEIRIDIERYYPTDQKDWTFFYWFFAITIPIISVVIISVVIIVIVLKKHKRKTPKEVIVIQERIVPKIMIIYCRECGAEILDKVGGFCSRCGSKIN